MVEKINLPQVTENIFYLKDRKMEDKCTQYEPSERINKAYSVYSSFPKEYKIGRQTYEPDLSKYEKVIENGIVIYRPKRNLIYESSITGIMENDDQNRLANKPSKYSYVSENKNENLNKQSLNYSRSKQEPS